EQHRDEAGARTKLRGELAPRVVEPVLLRTRRERGEHRVAAGSEPLRAKQFRRRRRGFGRDVQARQERAAVQLQVPREMQVFGGDARTVAVARDDLGDEACAALARTQADAARRTAEPGEERAL